MVEVLSDMPEGVTGVRVSGRLRGDDLREYGPAMEELEPRPKHQTKCMPLISGRQTTGP